MHIHHFILALAVAVAVLVMGAHALRAPEAVGLGRFESPVAFKPFEAGDRVAFLGDSITASGDYAHMIRLFYATRFPNRPLRLYNCGVGGARAETTWPRIDSDCLDLDPTIVAIHLGMNDTSGGMKTYREYMRRIMDRIADDSGRRLGLIVPSLYDQTAALPTANKKGKNDTIRAFGEWLVAQGRHRKAPVIDFNTPMLQVNAERQKADPAFSVVGRDRVHSGVHGHMVMTHSFLRAQGIQGPVSRVAIDVAAGSAKAEKASVDDVQTGNGRLSFVYRPTALPYPAEALPFATPAQEWVPFTEELNREWLVVGGLAEGRWALSMDGKTVGEFTADELAAGIDLARETNSPSYRHAHEVFALARQVEEAERNLRAIARVRWIILEPQGIDLADTERADAAVREYVSKRPEHTYWQNRAEVFFRFRAPETRKAERARMEGLMDRLYEINRPTAQRVELRHVTGRQTIAHSEMEPRQALPLRLRSWVGDHMILPADRSVPINGTAAPGTELTLEFAGQKKCATANEDGNWVVTLDPMPASRQGRELRITSPLATVGDTFKNVVVGSVWLCAGQSNMAMPVQNTDDEKAEAMDAIGSVDVRTFNGESWTKLTPRNVAKVSAVGAWFAWEMARRQNAPIGLSVAARGGTDIEAWVPESAFPDTDHARKILPLVDNPEVLEAARADAANPMRPYGEHRLARWGLGRAVPTSLFAQLVRPLADVPFRGVVWYQGESNSGSVDAAREYRHWLNGLIHGWREAFASPHLPFIVIQLPEYDWGTEAGRTGWAEIQKVQADVARELDGVWAVETTGLGDLNDIHPRRKKGVGIRAAETAYLHVHAPEDGI